MNGITLPIYICAQLKIFIIFVLKKNIELYKSIALNGEKTSQINKINLNIKNLYSELGIFLIQK